LKRLGIDNENIKWKGSKLYWCIMIKLTDAQTTNDN
jgi:hypothetical protein